MELKRNPKKCTFPKIIFQFDTDEEADQFMENWLHKDVPAKTNNNRQTEIQRIVKEKMKAAIGDIGCYADMLPIASIRTDESRFQNRTNAFSELSADSVAQNYDPNKFDPIVIWNDPNNKKDYVLSGHSRFEGMKRRKEPAIPARYFEGTEAQAIQFARIDANRSASSENLTEDLKAYILMRDGSIAKKIKPATQTAIKNAFKGTHAKLEAYSYLNSEGFFIQALQTENKSAFPYIETKALWIGELRKKYGEIFTNTYEDDCYNFLYNSSSLGLKMKKDEFFEEVQKRISKQETRLFPECNTQECVSMDALKERGPRGEPYRTLNVNQRDLDTIKERLATEKRSTRIYTEDERKLLIDVAQKLEKENKQIRRDVNIVEQTEASIFGIGAKNDKDPFFGYQYSEVNFDFRHKTLEKYVPVVIDIFNSKCSVSVFLGNKDAYEIVGFDTNNNAWSIFYRRINEYKREILTLKFASKADLLYIYSRVPDEGGSNN